ncbi:hypothetical protein AVEN_3900-1 [Araneus ventricosus]|uniref:Uncharacterized protein n=1 Tax=Araneus ventricosus TaxID=182803 RepID=A0A4Y2J827_ARAVE|nr:hypothetical protein AVEN_3900-1 [Araneus ventricosus]
MLGVSCEVGCFSWLHIAKLRLPCHLLDSRSNPLAENEGSNTCLSGFVLISIQPSTFRIFQLSEISI